MQSTERLHQVAHLIRRITLIYIEPVRLFLVSALVHSKTFLPVDSWQNYRCMT